MLFESDALQIYGNDKPPKGNLMSIANRLNVTGLHSPEEDNYILVSLPAPYHIALYWPEAGVSSPHTNSKFLRWK